MTSPFGLTIGTLLVLLSSLCSSRADAYPWLIKNGHTACVSCHMDPSGAGLLTAYGREQGDEEVAFQWSPGQDAPKAGLLWGKVGTPDWLLLGAGFRGAILDTSVTGAPAGAPGSPSASWSPSLILMQADLRAGLRLGHLRASGTLGVVTDGSLASVVGNVISREHWVGYAFDGDAYLIRAGRINVPFGIRSIEHTLWVRQETQTDINDTQQHGVAFAYSGQRLRGELMGILGNYQISPDSRRQRGYSGTLEVVPLPPLAVGVSSLVTHVAQDLNLHVENVRQAHGLFVRSVPIAPLVLFAEGDLVLNAPKGTSHTTGFTSMVQGDLEPRQGLHFILTGETWSPGTKSSYGGWAAVDWFCLRQLDVRLDFMWRKMAFGSDVLDAKAVLVQAHLYL
ncbi:MAG: hypothetical protein JWM82_1995 [Myxococcales bacterium]|nr:hypothetical protein [Myxococcales bacterium]